MPWAASATKIAAPSARSKRWRLSLERATVSATNRAYAARLMR